MARTPSTEHSSEYLAAIEASDIAARRWETARRMRSLAQIDVNEYANERARYDAAVEAFRAAYDAERQRVTTLPQFPRLAAIQARFWGEPHRQTSIRFNANASVYWQMRESVEIEHCSKCDVPVSARRLVYDTDMHRGYCHGCAQQFGLCPLLATEPAQNTDCEPVQPAETASPVPAVILPSPFRMTRPQIEAELAANPDAERAATLEAELTRRAAKRHQPEAPRVMAAIAGGSSETTCDRCHQVVSATYATAAGGMCEACRKDWWGPSQDAPPSHEEAAQPAYARCQAKHCAAPAIYTAEKPGCYRLRVCDQHADEASERGLTITTLDDEPTPPNDRPHIVNLADHRPIPAYTRDYSTDYVATEADEVRAAGRTLPKHLRAESLTHAEYDALPTVRVFSMIGPCIEYKLLRLNRSTFIGAHWYGDHAAEWYRKLPLRGAHLQPCSSCTDHPHTQYPNGYMD